MLTHLNPSLESEPMNRSYDFSNIVEDSIFSIAMRIILFSSRCLGVRRFYNWFWYESYRLTLAPQPLSLGPWISEVCYIHPCSSRLYTQFFDYMSLNKEDCQWLHKFKVFDILLSTRSLIQGLYISQVW